MNKNKLFVAVLSATALLCITACDYPPAFSISSESESSESESESSSSVDEKQQKTEMVDNFKYQSNVRITNNLEGEEEDDFLEKCFRYTKEVKQHTGYGRIFYAEFDRGFYAPEDYYFTETTTFYDDEVYEINYDIFNIDGYVTVTDFIKDGFEYHNTLANLGEEEQYCYKLVTEDEDMWSNNEYDTTYLVRYLFDRDEGFEIGYNKAGELIGLKQREHYEENCKIDTADIHTYVPGLDREQYIYTFEEHEDGYRIKSVTYYDQRQVKFDFENKVETRDYRDREIEKFYFELDYDTEVGNYDPAELEYLMTIAVLEDK